MFYNAVILIPAFSLGKKLRMPVLYDKMQKEEEKNKANRKKGKINDSVNLRSPSPDVDGVF